MIILFALKYIIGFNFAIKLCIDGKLEDELETAKNLDEYFIFRREFSTFERSSMNCVVDKNNSGIKTHLKL